VWIRATGRKIGKKKGELTVTENTKVCGAPALDNYGKSCFVKSDFLKKKCVCKTQMIPPPDHKKL
jgi:hypothetical protein